VLGRFSKRDRVRGDWENRATLAGCVGVIASQALGNVRDFASLVNAVSLAAGGATIR
jgi:hypothetical protein